MPFNSYIIGEGNKPGDITNDERALAQAAILNKELKAHTK